MTFRKCRCAAFAILVAALAAGCSGGKDGGTDGPAMSGGFVLVHVDPVDGGTGDGEFYVSEITDPLADIGMNDCVDSSTIVFESSTSEDAGATLLAISGSTTITMSRVTDGTEIYYSAALPVPGAPANASYKVTMDGASLGTVHVPDFPDPVLYSAGTVTWPEMGADEVLLLINGGTELWYCRTADDGSFALPGDLLAIVPTGYVRLNGFGYADAEHAGHRITLMGGVNSPPVAF